MKWLAPLLLLSCTAMTSAACRSSAPGAGVKDEEPLAVNDEQGANSDASQEEAAKTPGETILSIVVNTDADLAECVETVKAVEGVEVVNVLKNIKSINARAKTSSVAKVRALIGGCVAAVVDNDETFLLVTVKPSANFKTCAKAIKAAAALQDVKEAAATKSVRARGLRSAIPGLKALSCVLSIKDEGLLIDDPAL